MSGILFDDIIFGPVKSRRFGTSLGINLLPLDSKLCSFDCVYCECGLTGRKKAHKPRLFRKEQILEALRLKLNELKGTPDEPDSITFAGNGEPTMHPDFPEILDEVINTRNQLLPSAKITVLSNATLLRRKHIREALLKADNNVLKLDAGTDAMFQLINRPMSPLTLQEVVEQLMVFKGNLTIQTLFLRGVIENNLIDNTLPHEVEAWLQILKLLQPKLVMIYPIDRLTPFANLQKISHQELSQIAEKVVSAGLKAEVF